MLWTLPVPIIHQKFFLAYANLVTYSLYLIIDYVSFNFNPILDREGGIILNPFCKRFLLNQHLTLSQILSPSNQILIKI